MGADLAVSTGRDDLARGAIGLREVLFQSVTHMAPAGAVAFSIAVGAAYAGGSLSLSVLLALVACLLVASSIGQLARHLPSAGGFYTYAARGLHPWVGFLVGWEYSLVESLVAPVTYLVFGGLMAGVLEGPLHLPYGLLWAGFAVLVAVATAGLGYLGIGISARTGTALGVFEIVVFVALAVWLIVQAGSRNQLAVFGTGYATAAGFTGATGVVAGSVYAILAFIGFEAAAPLSEEAKDPGRVVPIAVIASALTIGVFYVLTTYAATVFFGPGKFGSFAQFGGGSPWIELAKQVWGVGWILVFLAVLNSTFANGNAGNNATTRTWYAMGRIGLLPRQLASTHPVRRSPHVAVAGQLVLSLVLIFVVGIPFGPITAFVFLATLVTAVVIAIYLVTNLACLVYYLRERRDEFSWLLHGVVPVLGIVAFVPALLTALGIGGQVLSFVSPLPFPNSLVGPIVGVWTVLGLLYLAYLVRRQPDRLRQTERVFVEEAIP